MLFAQPRGPLFLLRVWGSAVEPRFEVVLPDHPPAATHPLVRTQLTRLARFADRVWVATSELGGLSHCVARDHRGSVRGGEGSAAIHMDPSHSSLMR